MKQLLKFDKDGYEQIIERLNSFTNLFPAIAEELKAQGVQIKNYEQLKQGNILELFETHHKEQQQKNDITRDMVYSKFLELYGYNTINLEKLESQFKRSLENRFEFYSFNHSFYKYCEIKHHNDRRLMTYHESSPPIKSYQVYEFVIVKGNSIKIIVPKELFSLYATNEKQIETINDIMKFVELARKLNLSHSDIEKSIKEYLYFESNSFLQTRKQGLSKNLETVNFNFNHILTIQ